MAKTNANKAAEIEETEAQIPDPVKDLNAHMEEYVEYTAPISADPDEQPIFVSVNGENLRIKRGETVRVKRKFLAALRDAAEQERAAIRYQRQAASATGPIANL